MAFEIQFAGLKGLLLSSKSHELFKRKSFVDFHKVVDGSTSKTFY
jgi:hypothetical protein